MDDSPASNDALGKRKKRAKRRLRFRVFLILILSLLLTLFATNYLRSQDPDVKKYTFVVNERQVQVAKDTWVTMWTYNGQVPGPTIRAQVGQTIEITLINKTNYAHSIHSHGFDFENKDDGSIAANPPGSVVEPGRYYTYTFKAKRPGLFYYHCHSEDEQPVSVHTQQGLYGAVIIEDPNHPLPKADKEEVIFFGEVYGTPGIAMAHSCAYCTFAQKYFTIDARTYPLSKEFHPIKAKVGERVRFYVINIGNDIHSFHLHRQPQYLLERDANDEVRQTRAETQVTGLVPGEAATIDALMEEPGTWLFHCHVVPHADLGMVSAIVVEP